MIYITSELPKFCPQCGQQLSKTKMERDDFYAHATFECAKCATRYQYASREIILDAADKEGDMKRCTE